MADDEMLEEPLFRGLKPAPVVQEAPKSSTTSSTITLARAGAVRTDGPIAPPAANGQTRRPAGPSTTRPSTLVRSAPRPPALAVSKASPATTLRKPLSSTSRPLVSQGKPTDIKLAPRPKVTTPSLQPAPIARSRPATAAPGAARPVARPVNASTTRPSTFSRGLNSQAAKMAPKVDPRPIIKIDVPMMELDDEVPMGPDFEFDLDLFDQDLGSTLR